MKKILFLIVFIVLNTLPMMVFGQNYSFKKKFGTQKNTMYFYWGYNRSIYSKSDINFYSADYDFVVKDLAASDRPSTEFKTYVNPNTVTVPQFNVRLGWYYKFRWDVSIGYDHMKYVMDDGQSLYINGNVGATTLGGISGEYTDADGLIPISYDELHYENTNGLNYVSIQLNNTVPIFKTNNNKFSVLRRFGMGVGPVITQTDFVWDGVSYHSDYKQKFGGYGISVHAGLRADFFNRFFIQSNWSGGFIHLPKNATIIEKRHFANHKFVYGQWAIVGGVLFYIKTKGGCDTCPDWH